MNDDIHPADRVAISTCDSDDYCVTPGQRRKVNVYFDRGQPVLHVCKGCTRKGNKMRRGESNG
jgi:hypothetical protein